MATAGPLPSDIQPVENETRDRIITGLVTLVPFLAIGLAGWQVWGSALHWSDVFLFVGMYVLTGLGITVGFHRHLTHRSFKTYDWLHGLLAIRPDRLEAEMRQAIDQVHRQYRRDLVLYRQPDHFPERRQ